MKRQKCLVNYFQVALTSNLKKKNKREKLDSKINANVDEEEDIEGLDFSTLREDQMKQLREMISTIPPYLFMSAPEKRKYFANVSKTFATNIEKEKGTQCSHKRKVKFDLNRNQVKCIKYSQFQCSEKSKVPPEFQHDININSFISCHILFSCPIVLTIILI